MTADCAWCGPASRIAKGGFEKDGVTRHYRCYTSTSNAYPKKQGKIAPQEHKISEVDPETKTGLCAKCGIVTVYPRGLRKGVQKWRCLPAVKAHYPKRDKAYQRNFNLKRNYGMTQLDYDEMFLAQKGLCAICGNPPSGDHHFRLAVDHCHESKKVRGLLCILCNVSLGGFKDSAELLENAIRYLQRHASPVPVPTLSSAPWPSPSPSSPVTTAAAALV